MNEYCTRNGVPICNRLVKMQQMLCYVLETIPNISQSDMGVAVRKELEENICALLDDIGA
jgi:hypothetical protein